MAKMQLVITLRKEVDEVIEGRQIFEMVKERLSDREDVKITGHITNHFTEESEE